jgi:hypothetical protein
MYTSLDQGVAHSRGPVGAKNYSDFLVDVNIEQTDPSSGGTQGVAFRINEDNEYYMFMIDSHGGEYWLDMRNKADWKVLIDPTKSSHIRSTGPNKVTVLAQGPHFVFFINGQFVAEITDRTLPNGWVYLAVNQGANTSNTYEFDNFELRAPIQ